MTCTYQYGTAMWAKGQITVTKETGLEIKGNINRTMPRELWARAPVAECQRFASPPPFLSVPELMRLIAPVITYLSVALSYTHDTPGGPSLSFRAFCTLASFGISLVRWAYRSLQQRNEEST